MIPGKRESRRFEGDVMLTQQDVIEQRGSWRLVRTMAYQPPLRIKSEPIIPNEVTHSFPINKQLNPTIV